MAAAFLAATSVAVAMGCASVPGRTMPPEASRPRPATTAAMSHGPTGSTDAPSAPGPSGARPANAAVPAAAQSPAVDLEKMLACVATANEPMPLELERIEGLPVMVLGSEALGPEDGLSAWQIWRTKGPPCGVRPVLVRELASPPAAPVEAGVPESLESPSDGDIGSATASTGHERLREARALMSATTATALLAEREQALREVERERNEWLAKARAGTLTDPSDEEAARCRRTPDRCPPEHELGDQRASLPADGTALAAPSPSRNEPSWEFVHDLADPSTPEEGASPVQLLLVAADPWLLPAVLDFGAEAGWPSTAGHAVLLGHWYRKYGAEIVYMDRDTMELWVERPPERHADIVELAWEQYLYCPDIVAQGTGTVGELARALTGRSWLFWWE